MRESHSIFSKTPEMIDNEETVAQRRQLPWLSAMDEFAAKQPCQPEETGAEQHQRRRLWGEFYAVSKLAECVWRVADVFVNIECSG
jgi:hypothetical protein